MEKVVFYDCETTGKFAQYCDLKLVGYAVDDGEPVVCTSDTDHHSIRGLLADPETIKVGYNNGNFDDIVLGRFGYPVNPANRHDLFLLVKAVCPTLPAYGMKFVNWFFCNDHHEPERRLHAWMQHNGVEDMYLAPAPLLKAYLRHDVLQTRRLWKLFAPYITEGSAKYREHHERAYCGLELPFIEVLHEIMLYGGDCTNVGLIRKRINDTKEEIANYQSKADYLTRGKITNANSTKQVAEWLKEIESIELKYNEETDNYQLRKEDLLELLDLDDPKNDKSRVARYCYEVRHGNKQLAYLRSYRRAALYELRKLSARRLYRQRGYVQIPKSYSLSGARTRRILSSSRFGINFQNPNKTAKQIQLVPSGWLGVWIDETQIENVVHIWASDDEDRRVAYEADPEYNEYVWLCNRVLGGNRTKKELDSIPSSSNPGWTVYKQYKTCKLSINFGLGVREFSRRNRIPLKTAEGIYAKIHEASPAIKELIKKVKREINKKGFVRDPWGHIYSGDPDAAYKIVSYLIQGTGTGSISKAVGRAIYDVLQGVNDVYSRRIYDVGARLCVPGLLSESTNHNAACATGLTHDETAFRLSLLLPDSVIVSTIWRCLYCAEQQFSPLFDGIPLRAKAAFSISNCADQEELNHYKLDKETFNQRVLEKFVYPARERDGIKPINLTRVKTHGNKDETESNQEDKVPAWSLAVS